MINYIRDQLHSDYIIQGQKACKLEDHYKPMSLDYWLRRFARDPNLKQADNSVMEALVATGLFTVSDNLECPTTGRICKGLVLR